MRTYAGHSTASESNALFRRNLAKGQTGLSVAFDLPTQTGYDADHVLARGEVGRVGVPVGHLGDVRALFDGIALEQANTSMTINATAMWLLALYQVAAEEQGADIARLTGTTQNDIIKEYLSRGTYVFPPGPSLRLATDVIAYTVTRMPKWNPVNICSYHLQEAGATPVQEIAYALCTAMAVLDAVRDSGQVPADRMGEVVGADLLLRQRGRPVRRGDVQDAGVLPALGHDHPGAVRDHRPGAAPLPVRRAGQLAGPDRGAAGEQHPADRAGDAGRHLVQGRPGPRRPAARLERGAGPAAARRTSSGACASSRCSRTNRTCWSTATCSTGPPWWQAKTGELLAGAEAEIAAVAGMGGVIAAVESGYLKARLVASHAARRARIESGEDKVVGVNCFQATEPSPLTADADDGGPPRGPGLRAERCWPTWRGGGSSATRRPSATPWPGWRPRRPARTST